MHAGWKHETNGADAYDYSNTLPEFQIIHLNPSGKDPRNVGNPNQIVYAVKGARCSLSAGSRVDLKTTFLLEFHTRYSVS